MMFPMKSWDGSENLESFEQLRALEESLGGAHAIVVNTRQMAIQLCLEALGSRSHMTPVALPVTSSLETFTGVIWSGAMPVILDTDLGNLQVNLNDLAELLETSKAVVLLDRVNGAPTHPAVLDAVLDVPTIAVCQQPPSSCLDQLDLDATFSIFDLSEVIGTGAVIYHRHKEGQYALRFLRGGPLGHKAWLTEELAAKALERLALEAADERQVAGEQAYNRFEWELRERNVVGIMLWEMSDLAGPLYFHVPDSTKMATHLRSYGISCRETLYPLHQIPEVRRRLSDEAEYPAAEWIHKHTIIIPSHEGVLGHVTYIVDKMIECVRGNLNDSRSSSITDDSQG